MAILIASFKRFAIVLAFLVILAVSTVYLFDVFARTPINVFIFSRESLRILIIVGFWLAILLLVRRAKPFMTSRIGIPATTILQMFIGAIAVLVMTFGVLNTFGVSAESLLTGAGIASITVGLIISTFVGGVLSGAVVFATHTFRVGDDVLVNNIPARIVDMTTLVTRVRTDVGQISIPNSAIASGSVMMICLHKHETKSLNRLPYSAGDRVVSTYMTGEGVVTELTPIHTVILLDSGEELTFLNNSVLSGSVAIARKTMKKNTRDLN